MRGHVSALTSHSRKVNTIVFVILLQVHKMDFSMRWQISIIQVKALKFATYSKNSHALLVQFLQRHVRRTI